MKIVVCNWKSCQDRFCKYTEKRLESDIEKFDLKNVILEKWACMGMCKIWPNISLDWDIINHVDPAKASKLMFDKINNR